MPDLDLIKQAEQVARDPARGGVEGRSGNPAGHAVAATTSTRRCCCCCRRGPTCQASHLGASAR